MNGAAKGADNHLCRSEPVSVQIPGKYKKYQQIRSSRIAWLPIQMEYRRLYRWQEPNTRGFRSVGLRSAARRGRRPPPLAQPLCYSEPSRRHQALPSRPPRAQDSPQITGPNSTSTGVGVLTGVLNWSLPSAKSMWKTAILSVF